MFDVQRPSLQNFRLLPSLAAGLELMMLLTPYTAFFAIRITALFVAVTLTAHVLFGLTLGRVSRWMQRRSTPLLPAKWALEVGR